MNSTTKTLSKEDQYLNNQNIGLVVLENSKLIYKAHSCNLGGDPSKNFRGSNQRSCNLSVPESIANHLKMYGVDVKQTQPYGDEVEGFIPDYFVKVIAGFKDNEDDLRNPKFYLVKNGSRIKIGKNDLQHDIDKGRISTVKATLSPWTWDDGSVTLYIRHFYAYMFEEDDPFAKDFEKEATAYPTEDDGEEMPWD